MGVTYSATVIVPTNKEPQVAELAKKYLALCDGQNGFYARVLCAVAERGTKESLVAVAAGHEKHLSENDIYEDIEPFIRDLFALRESGYSPGYLSFLVCENVIIMSQPEGNRTANILTLYPDRYGNVHKVETQYMDSPVSFFDD